MSTVELSIDEKNEGFLISGDINLIYKNYRAKYFFLDFLKADFHDTIIFIPYEKDEKEKTLQTIQEALSKYRIQQTDSDDIKKVLHNYYIEKENFREFSRKANDIWKNNVDVNEFKYFKEVLIKEIPNRVLYDKQLLASFHLAFSQNACNFSVPGAGKTSMVYAAFAYLRSLPIENPKKVNKILVIGPLSSFGPWEDEYLQCFGKHPYSVRLSGGIPKDERDRILLSMDVAENTPELILMSYQSVSYNLSSLTYFLQRPNNKVMVILDEAHRIKNVEGGVWAQSVLELSKFCSSRVVLTGTPAPNGYEDLYNLFEFIWPGKEIIDFPIYQLKDMSINQYDERIKKLINNIKPYFIRIRKSHLDLPPILDNEPNYVEMGPVQREIYDFIENNYLSQFIGNEKSPLLTSELTKAKFIRLMQVATNPNLLKRPLETFFHEQGLGDELHIDDAEIIKKIVRYSELEEVPQKFVVVKNLIVNLLSKGEKIIVWTTFIQNSKELQDFLAKHNIASRLLIGEVPVERDDISMENVLTREKIIQEFHQPNSTFSVIIANPFAVSESISLHQACHNAIYLERTFNATHFIQSKDRIHRIGLDPHIITNYHFILSARSIDETIHQRLSEKEQRMLEIIESQEIPLFSENMDYDIDLDNDIKAVIRDYVRRTP